MWTILYGPTKASEMALGTEKRKKAEFEKSLDYLQDQSPYMVSLFEAGEAVTNPWGRTKLGGV